MRLSNHESLEPCKQDEKVDDQEKTTMFLNKYCEDTSIPSVANKLADTIIQYEINQHIPFLSRNDDQIDDEVIGEEEFLKNEDEEIDAQDVA